MTKNELIKKILAAFFFAFCCNMLFSSTAFAQQPPWVQSKEPVITDPQVLPDQYESNDSLNEVENELTGLDSLQEPKVSFANVDVPTYEDSIYSARLNALATPVNLTYNDEVKKYINLYVLNRREQVARMLGLSKIYFPVFDEVFAQYGIPPEIKYLSIIESALNPHAVSRVGATGMWQFMYGTAKQYGLNINSYIDERKDIIRSTEGAAQYLRGMFDIYGDWLLAIASYNCGPGNINRAISQSGGKTFWEIRNYLPKETRNYVPAFIAATYVMTYYDLHDLSPQYPKYSFETITTVDVSEKMSCDQIARFTGLSMEEFKFLNPGLKCSVIPGGTIYSYACKLPADRIAMFDASKDSIILYSVNAKAAFEGGYAPGSNFTYTVRKGDNLGKIAAKYHVSVSQLKKWNHLHSSTIRAGQKLKINSGRSATSSSTAAAFNKSAPAVKSDTTIKNTTASSVSDSIQKVIYTVRQGDNLQKIATAHAVTVAEIKTWNKLTGTTIIPGQRLKIYDPKNVDHAAMAATKKSDPSTDQTVEVKEPLSQSKTLPVTESTIYTVKKGDNLGKIAASHQVTVAQIKEWNNMNTTTILIGQKLKIFAAEAEAKQQTTAAATMSENSNQSNMTAGVAGKSVTPGKTAGKQSPTSTGYVYYKARNGDTLWDIAQRHGTTVAEIRKLNGASKCNNLKAGTVLKLSSKG